MIKYERLIFVCTGNTCRGPMAEVIFRSLDTESDIEIMSRGLVVLFPEPSNPKADTVLRNHNLSIGDHIAKALEQEDIDEDTLVLAMTQEQKEKVQRDYENCTNVYTLKEFVGEDGDVSDPYGQSLTEYEECYVELARLIKKTVYKLNEED
ncbi:low molecular weight protein arginine phosphatase [Anaerosporobacter faecicola]|uniref:low molecular weight protein arginine phosphatase n=1 Tax=Anaerosporobacter faecicola TaxID=2718714 RepID=UPI00236865D9|nr:low molecular weight protein arginine phosphatase [Anaerosporobacter faecicola]